MTRPFGIQGSTTSHGGIVMASQSRITQMGISFLRVGDGFACPKCNMWSTLIKSHDHVIMDGRPVAFAGDQLTCGATIQPQQSPVFTQNYLHPRNLNLPHITQYLRKP